MTQVSWEEDAKTGAPTSAAPPAKPDDKTPERAAFFDVPLETPEAVPLPMKKVELAAEKRMQQQIKNSKGKVKHAHQCERDSVAEAEELVGERAETNEMKKQKKKHGDGEWIESKNAKKQKEDSANESGQYWNEWELEDEQMEPEKARKKEKKAKKEKEQSGEKTEKPKKTRKPNDGPLGLAMGVFLAKRKSKKVPHWEAMAEWKVSAERQAIVDRLGEAERKRRRF